MKTEFKLTLPPSSSDSTGQKLEYNFEVSGIMTAERNKWETVYGIFMSLEDMQKIQEEFNKENGVKTPKNQKVNYNQVRVKAADIDNVTVIEDAIKAMGFGTWSMQNQRQEMQQSMKQMQMILGGLGAISMLVSAISITNTMIMSVYERTREIGVMKAFDGESVVVGGWIKTLRDSKAIGFIELGDGSSFKNLQVVFEDAKIPDYKEIAKLNVGTAIYVEGKVVLTPESKQPLELHASEITVEGSCPPDYPLQKKRHSLEYLRSIAHLRPRTNTFNAVFRVRSVAAFALHSFFNEHGFVYVHTPIITGSDAEGAGEMFRVTTLDDKNPPLTKAGAVDYSKDFFGSATSLTVSGQLEGECFALAMRDIYTFGPTFRAENSNTPRHASEFWMMEPEIAFADLNDNMALAEDMLKYTLKFVLWSAVPTKCGSSTISTTRGCSTASTHKDKFEYPVFWGCDLQTEHERFLTEQIFKKPVFVIDYPKEIKAFYMRLNDDDKTVAAMDLLGSGVGEIIGGSQREERLDVLESRMDELKLDKKGYEWYLDLRRYGGTKHAGFGLGFERLLMYMTGVSNIRDVMPFPRVKGSAEF
ncbi:aspartyl/lysyl-trna synthetase [Holotrichia oblita]|uniref:Aspartyl/lysyl-trna synthetase n=1 Tax=Holotrichia oblita TaxID=644536 RepID=A0ACB9TL30_HOLOL|nr:aspartyl/lysyl-trna synthetase [Holotrichia oblita]